MRLNGAIAKPLYQTRTVHSKSTFLNNVCNKLSKIVIFDSRFSYKYVKVPDKVLVRVLVTYFEFMCFCYFRLKCVS